MRSATALLSFFLILIASPTSVAQGTPSVPRPQPAAGSVPVVAAPLPPEVAARRRAAHADARVCLEFPTDVQVIACSEKYRWAKGS